MRLYNYWRSSSSWRVRIALHWKALPFEYVPVSLIKGEQFAADYVAKNPTSHIPCLEIVDQHNQTHYLAQSLAILEWLEEMQPAPPLLPRDPIARARVRQLAEIVNSTIQPMQNLVILKAVKAMGGDDRAFPAEHNQRGLEAFAAIVGKTGGKFCVGNEVSFADVCLIPQLYSARRFGVELHKNGLERLVEIEHHLVTIPAFAASHPDNQPDTPPPAL